jgi:hypothetical protein
VKVLLGQQKGRRTIWSIRRSPGSGLSSYQFVENIGTQLIKLNRGKAQKLVAGFIGLLLVIWVAGVEKSAQSNIVLAEDGLVEIAADAVTTTFAASIELGAVTRPSN